MTDFGAGPVLSENFDFEITANGDIKTDSGLAELEKDVAFIVAETMYDLGLGEPFTDEYKEDVRIELGVAIKSDPRINEITKFVLEQDSNNDEQLNIEIDTNTNEGPFELIIPL